MGPAGSSGNGDAAVVSEAMAEAAAEAYCLWRAEGVATGAGRAIGRRRAGRTRPAVRRSEAMVDRPEGKRASLIADGGGG